MSVSITAIRDAWCKNYGTALSNYRQVHTSTQSVSTANQLPRYTYWGTNGDTLMPDNGAVSMYNLAGSATSDNHGLWMDAIQVRFQFTTKRYDNIDGTFYYAPVGSWINNNTSRSITVSGASGGYNTWAYVKDGSTNLAAVKGLMDSGRYPSWGAWYGTATLYRVYYYIYHANSGYAVFNTTSTSLAGYKSGASLGTVSNSYGSQTGGISGSYSYMSLVFKNRIKT
ncbi:hypothetical protein VPHK567_0313 [Vibrio phage K567]